MPRRHKPTSESQDWFLKEWMADAGLRPIDLARKLDMPKQTFNGIYNGPTGYYRDIVNPIAAALGIEPYELLMPPAKARAIRNIIEAASAA